MRETQLRLVLDRVLRKSHTGHMSVWPVLVEEAGLILRLSLRPPYTRAAQHRAVCPAGSCRSVKQKM